MKRRIIFGVGAGMFGLAVDGLSGLMLYPLLLNRLGAEAAGLWMVMLSVAALMNLAQASMGPVITRNIARSFNNPKRLDDQIKNIKTIAALLTIALFFIGVILYFTYIELLFEKAGLKEVGWNSWMLFTAGIASFSYAQFRMFVLNGLGHVGIDKVARALCVAIGFGTAWVSVHFTHDFRALAASYCAQNIIFMIASNLAFRIQIRKTIKNGIAGRGRLDYELIKSGARILVLNSSAYILNNFAIFLAERNQGLDFVPKYTAMTRIGLLLSAISLLIPQMAFPYVARSSAENNIRQVRRYYVIGVLGSVTVFVFTSASVLLLADWLFPLWLGSANYLGKTYLASILLYFLIYVSHIAQSQPVLAIGAADFLLCAILNAIAVALIMLFTSDLFGIWSYPISLIFGTLPFSIYVARIGMKNILFHAKASNEK